MKPLNFREPIAWLIILALGFFLCGQCESNRRKDLEREQGERLHQEQVQKLEDSVRIAGVRIKELQVERVKLLDSVRVAVKSKKRQIKAHEETAEKLRPEISARLDSVPVLKAFVGSLESTIAKQKELIQGLELAHSAEIINLESQLKESARQNVKQIELTEVWRLAAVSSQKNVRKLERGKRFRNVVIGVLTAGLVVISIRE